MLFGKNENNQSPIVGALQLYFFFLVARSSGKARYAQQCAHELSCATYDAERNAARRRCSERAWWRALEVRQAHAREVREVIGVFIAC